MALVGGVIRASVSSFNITSSACSNSAAAAGGVVFTSVSSFNIVSSIFIDNTAFAGGVIATITDSLYNIFSSIFMNNIAANDSGGVIITDDSSFNVTNSAFINNNAGTSGGVMITFDSSFNVTNIAFINNSAGVGGVIITSNSSFSISSSTFTNNSVATLGGVMYTSGSSLYIASSLFVNNTAAGGGGIIADGYDSIISSANAAASGGGDSYFNVTNSVFINNSAGIGGVMFTFDSSFSITSSTFANNSVATIGGVMYTSGSSLYIASSLFVNNTAAGGGGVIAAGYYSIISSANAAASGGGDSYFNVTNSVFINNSAGIGGVMFTFDSSFSITSSTFANNSVATIGGVMYTSGSSLYIASSLFVNNTAAGGGGVIAAGYYSIISSANAAASGGGVMVTGNGSFFIIINSSFINNSAAHVGGVVASVFCSFNIISSVFTNNTAGVIATSNIDSLYSISSSIFDNNSILGGGVIGAYNSAFNFTNCTVTNNSASTGGGGVALAGNSSFTIIGSSFYANKANILGGIMVCLECSILITDSIFGHNSGSLYILDTNLTFSGYTRFESCAEPNKRADGAYAEQQEGGAITSNVQSTVIFSGVSSLSNNKAGRGGAILAAESTILMYGEITIDNNTATASSGGGISLHQSDLEVRGNCIISDNCAMTRGGAIHATSSTIAVYQPWTLQLVDNRAKNGSGVYLEASAKLYILKFTTGFEHLVVFRDNDAMYGGAIYLADDTNSGTCSSGNECFIQTLAINQDVKLNSIHELISILFSGNTASEKGANLFGGLLDRCIPSQFAEVYTMQRIYYSGVNYLGNISNIAAIDTISSLPVRICFCKSENESEPDCSYQPPTFKVKKGGTLTVPLVAVDQVNHSVAANIISSLSSQDGGFNEGQQAQSAGRYCSNVTFNVFSPHNSETINLYADGPCGNSRLSSRQLYIEFTDCTCPIGFQPFASNTRCECDCDSKLSRYITDCNATTESLVRVNTNSWITHINDTDPPGYIIHPNCPLDYCRPPTENISMNLNLPDGSDAQCAYNRSGILCGVCQEHFSLSLGSSRCLLCHSYWPVVFAVILIATIIAGILLVTALLVLNMTVAIGLINDFIFYANLVAANSAVFFPSSEPSFPTVFVAWLNLDIGIDVCFFDGLDAYTNAWLQLAFPIYIISLVIVIIIVSESSPRFARLIGKRDPIAALATLIQLSYAKLLSVTITALSFAVLNYPDGSRVTVWLADGNLPYFQGKHVALALVALLIIVVGVPYTILLFLWQWIVRAPKWKVFKWTRNTKLNAFISVHHAPYNNIYRYWTGLLLFLRVVLYITISVTVSGDPETSLLMTFVLVGSLSFVKEITGARVYKNSFLNIVGAMLYFNLLALSGFSWYRFKADFRKQTAVAYSSTIITFILLVGVIIYHVYLLVRKDRHRREFEEEHEYLQLAPVQPATAEVTYSIVEIPKPCDQSPQLPADYDVDDKIEVRELLCTETIGYQ